MFLCVRARLPNFAILAAIRAHKQGRCADEDEGGCPQIGARRGSKKTRGRRRAHTNACAAIVDRQRERQRSSTAATVRAVAAAADRASTSNESADRAQRSRRQTRATSARVIVAADCAHAQLQVRRQRATKSGDLSERARADFVQKRARHQNSERARSQCGRGSDNVAKDCVQAHDRPVARSPRRSALY